MRPQLEVLWSVVVLDPVEVMHRLASNQVATEKVLHHEHVLEDVPVAAGTRQAGHRR